jgi:hypothetical protein
MADVREMLESPEFFGQGIVLIQHLPGRPSPPPTEKAHAAIRLLRPLLEYVASEQL